MAVLAITGDLIFGSKIEATGVAENVFVSVIQGSDGLRPAPDGSPWSLVLVDLALSRTDPVELIAAVLRALPKVPVVGYCAHIEEMLGEQALTAGCHKVLSRQEFMMELPELMRAAG